MILPSYRHSEASSGRSRHLVAKANPSEQNLASMEAVFDEIVRRCQAGEKVILCTVVATRGSTPQEKGARMLVVADGRTVGTLGGGCVEAEVRKRALEMLGSGLSQ